MASPQNLAEAMAQWARVGQMNNQGRLMGVRANQAEQQQADQQSIAQLYRGGQRPTAEQVYAINPMAGQQFEQDQAQNDLISTKAQTQKMAMAKDIASGIRNKMMQSGLEPGTPEFQQQLDGIGAPYRPIISKIFGHQDDPNKPMDWQALTAIADSPIGNEYHPPVNSTEGLLEYRNGNFQPMQINGKIAMSPTADPDNVYAVSAAREAPKLKPIETEQGPTYKQSSEWMKPKQGQKSAFMSQAEQDHVMGALNSDDPNERAWAEKVLQNAEKMGASVPSGGPVGMSYQQKKAIDEQSTKNTEQAKADISIKKEGELASSKKERQAGEILSYLETPIEGDKIEDIIKQATGSLAGSVRDSAMGAVGQDTKAGLAAAKLKVISSWLAGNVPRFEGPQSDADREYYAQMSADLGNEKTTAGQKLAKLQALRAMMARNHKVQKQTVFDEVDSILNGAE